MYLFQDTWRSSWHCRRSKDFSTRYFLGMAVVQVTSSFSFKETFIHLLFVALKIHFEIGVTWYCKIALLNNSFMKVLSCFLEKLTVFHTRETVVNFEFVTLCTLLTFSKFHVSPAKKKKQPKKNLAYSCLETVISIRKNDACENASVNLSWCTKRKSLLSNQDDWITFQD